MVLYRLDDGIVKLSATRWRPSTQWRRFLWMPGWTACGRRISPP